MKKINNKESKMIIQQGDVILEKVEKVPERSKEKKGNVLVEGEVTGHAHRIDTKAPFKLYENDGMLYIENEQILDVVHEEHDTVTIPDGIWQVRKVKEYDHFLEEAREVQD